MRCKSGTVGMASHRALSFAMRLFSETYGSDPMGAPSTVMPCHTLGPRSAMFSGGIPPLFQALVLTWCNWIPATLINASTSKTYNSLHNSFTLAGSHKR